MIDRAAGRLGRRLAAGATLAVLVAAGCAGEADGGSAAPDAATGGAIGEFAATSEYLDAVADATDGQTYRMSVDMTMAFSGMGEDFEMGGTILTGEVDGDRAAQTMDLGELFRDMNTQLPASDQMPQELLDSDLTIEMIIDGSTLYLRAPYFAALGEMARDAGASTSDLGPLGDLAELGDEWGSVDLTELSVAEITSAAGGQQVDPGVYLDMISEGTDVQDLGADTIDGVGVRGLGATITYGDVMRAEGVDADEFTDEMADDMADDVGGTDDEVRSVFEAMMATEIPTQVWVDGDDRVRRVTIDMNLAEMMSGLAEQAGEDVGDVGMSMAMVMDFTDYDDETIEIEIPEATTDLTDEYRALVDEGGVDTGVGGSPFGST